MALFCREVTKSCKHKKIKRKNNVFIRLMEASVLSYITDIQIFSWLDLIHLCLFPMNKSFYEQFVVTLSAESLLEKV